MVKTNAVPPYKKFKIDLKLRKNRNNTLNGFHGSTSTSFRISPQRMPSNINVNTHRQPINIHSRKPPPRPPTHMMHNNMNQHQNYNFIPTVPVSPPQPVQNEANISNPFNDPPLNCTESDLRWLWRKRLEARRGHINNRQFYSNYVGSKKARKEKSETQIDTERKYVGTHHLKHLVKIGCPEHDLKPILNDLAYNINAAVCTQKSHICAHAAHGHNSRHLVKSFSMKNIGLLFTRNAFSTSPLRIEYTPTSMSGESKTNDMAVGMDIFVKRIANTNFSKAFRPGSYGKFQSFKKGSWKEGKIFYVFENDELILSLTENISLAFDLQSCASNGDNEQNTIDGWKHIAGGVGFYRPPSSNDIATVLVLRKHPSFPLECLQNSTIRVYSSGPNPSGILQIGSQVVNFDAINSRPAVPLLTDIASSVSSYQSNDEQEFADALNVNNNFAHCAHFAQQNVNNMYQNNFTDQSVVFTNNNMQNQFDMNVDDEMSRIKHEYNVLALRNNELESVNMHLVESNRILGKEKQLLESQVCELQSYMTQQHQQITKLTQQIETNTFFEAPQTEFTALFPSPSHDDCNSVMYPPNDYYHQTFL